MNLIAIFACVHWQAGESGEHIHSCEPLSGILESRGCLPLQRWPGKVSSEHFYSHGKNRTKSVFSKVIILYINHSACNNMLSIIHSCNTHRVRKKSFVMRWLVKINYDKICLFTLHCHFIDLRISTVKSECATSKPHYLKDTF